MVRGRLNGPVTGLTIFVLRIHLDFDRIHNFDRDRDQLSHIFMWVSTTEFSCSAHKADLLKAHERQTKLKAHAGQTKLQAQITYAEAQISLWCICTNRSLAHPEVSKSFHTSRLVPYFIGLNLLVVVWLSLLSLRKII